MQRARKSSFRRSGNPAKSYPGEWDRYAMWMIEKVDGTHIGDLCFKDIESDHYPEIGYGILEEYREEGFATAAVKLV